MLILKKHIIPCLSKNVLTNRFTCPGIHVYAVSHFQQCKPKRSTLTTQERIVPQIMFPCLFRVSVKIVDGLACFLGYHSTVGEHEVFTVVYTENKHVRSHEMDFGKAKKNLCQYRTTVQLAK